MTMLPESGPDPFLALLAANKLIPPEIVVNAKKQQEAATTEDDPAPPNLGNRSMIEEAQQAKGNAPKHKGMFGIKGTLRDVLGLLGDSLLSGSGRQAIYSPVKQKETQGDALSGFTQNPLAAFERMSQVNPEFAAELYKNYSASQARSQAAAAAAQTASQTRLQKGAELFGRFYGASNKESYARIIPILTKIKESYGLGDEFSVAPEYDENTAHAYQYGGMPAQAQVRDNRQGEAEQGRNDRAQAQEQGRNGRAAIQEQGRDRRDNAPQRGKAVAEAEIVDAITNGTATPGQQKYYDEVIKRPVKSGLRGKYGLPDKPATSNKGGKFVIRNGKMVKQ